MGIIDRYSGYIGAHGLPREIEHAPELKIAKRYAALNDELAKLRLNTIASTYVDGKGNLKVNQTPSLTALQARIAEKEQALEKLVQLASQIDETLQANGVESIRDLGSQREAHANTIQSGPVRAWDEFRLTRERPPGNGGYPHLLPSDLARVESYAAFEAGIRADMDAAKAALEPIEANLKRLNALVAEATGL